LLALHAYSDSDLFSVEEKLALRLADAMTASPAVIGGELFDELRKVFREEQIVELASALAWENYRARFNRVFDVESENFSDGAFCPVPIRSDAGQRQQ
jgi:alkylhydroperoxidase family enzyme